VDGRSLKSALVSLGGLCLRRTYNNIIQQAPFQLVGWRTEVSEQQLECWTSSRMVGWKESSVEINSSGGRSELQPAREKERKKLLKPLEQNDYNFSKKYTRSHNLLFSIFPMSPLPAPIRTDDWGCLFPVDMYVREKNRIMKHRTWMWRTIDRSRPIPSTCVAPTSYQLEIWSLHVFPSWKIHRSILERKRRLSCHQNISPRQRILRVRVQVHSCERSPFVLTNNARETARISLTEFQKPSFLLLFRGRIIRGQQRKWW